MQVVGLLKSTSALKTVTVIGRIAYTLVPGSLFAFVRRTKRARRAEAAVRCHGLPSRLSRQGLPLTTARPNFRVLVGLISLPFVLTFALWLISLERTPITGRIRPMRLSPEEEAELVRAVLGAESGAVTAGGDRAAQAWIGILRRVLEQERAPAGTLFGHGFLPQDDWRTQFAEAILRVLEAGVPRLGENDFVADAGDLRVPPLTYPLRRRSAATGDASESIALDQPSLQILVLDSPDSNAFAIGFGPTTDSSGQGVIVVFRGFLDALFGQAQVMEQAASVGSSLFGVFSSLAPAARSPRTVVVPPEPTQAQAQSLAVILAHELSQCVQSRARPAHDAALCALISSSHSAALS